MNYGNIFVFFHLHFIFRFHFSRAGVPEKYCADIERKVHGAIHVNQTATNTNTPPVH